MLQKRRRHPNSTKTHLPSQEQRGLNCSKLSLGSGRVTEIVTQFTIVIDLTFATKSLPASRAAKTTTTTPERTRVVKIIEKRATGNIFPGRKLWIRICLFTFLTYINCASDDENLGDVLMPSIIKVITTVDTPQWSSELLDLPTRFSDWCFGCAGC